MEWLVKVSWALNGSNFSALEIQSRLPGFTNPVVKLVEFDYFSIYFIGCFNFDYKLLSHDYKPSSESQISVSSNSSIFSLQTPGDSVFQPPGASID